MNKNICPLFDTLKKLQQVKPLSYSNIISQYPDIDNYLSSLTIEKPVDEYMAVVKILLAAGRRSFETYNRFRSDIEKFLLFMWGVKKKSIIAPTRSDIDDFIDYFVKPEAKVIGFSAADRFIPKDGRFVMNPLWKPYLAKKSKGLRKLQADGVTHERICGEASINACYSALSRLYNGLVEEGYSSPNWISVSKKYCPYLVRRQSKSPIDSSRRMVKRLSDDEWDFLLDIATQLADENPAHERKLFVLCSLKSLYLRVSELSTDNGRLPVFDDFSKDHEGTWFLMIIGKGTKERHVSIPHGFLDNLKRYRIHRGLPPLPVQGENHLILENSRRKGGVTSRTIMNDVQFIFDHAYTHFKEKFGEERAKAFLVASSHWLRHTGASMSAINEEISAKDLAEELGHSDSRTTDVLYIKNATSDRGKRLRNRSM